MPTETRPTSQSGARSGQPLPRVTLVVAMADNGVIGRDGALPWRLPADLRRFKAQTLGKPVLMGRRTFESIGRALPGRLNLVLTRSRDWQPPVQAGEVTVVHDWDGALAAAGAAPELMVIGGAEIYAMAADRADRVLLTRVHAEVAGDTRLPPFDAARWVEATCEPYPADELNPIPMSFVELRRA
jgi:dihydrofolate reductase